VTLRGVLIAGDNLPKAGRHTALAASGGIHARADTPHWRFGGTQAKAERKNFEQVGYRLCRHAGVASDNTCNGASGELRNATTPTKAERAAFGNNSNSGTALGTSRTAGL
jgi:hypothetical protein